MRIICVVAFVLGVAVTLGSMATLADYASGHLERWSKWGDAGPVMAKNTATLFLMTGLAIMGLAAAGEHALARKHGNGLRSSLSS